MLIDAKGRFFSVGGDLNALAAQPRRTRALRFRGDIRLAHGHFALRAHERARRVAVHAMAAGGAVALIAGADFALAASSAQILRGVFAGIGIVSDSGGSYYLPRRMGSRRATQFYMLNETLSAEEAATLGLINRVVDTGGAGRRGHGAGASSRSGADAGLRRGQEPAAAEFDRKLSRRNSRTEARAMARVTRTDDAWNAMRAMLAKQKPTFEGR